MKDSVSRINITTKQDIEISTDEKTMECKKSLPSLKYIELMGIYLVLCQDLAQIKMSGPAS